MRKLVILAVALVLLAGLGTACGSKKGDASAAATLAAAQATGAAARATEAASKPAKTVLKRTERFALFC